MPATAKGAGEDPLALAAHDFELISNEPTTSKTRIFAQGTNGDEIAEDTHDTKTERTLKYLYKGTETDLRDAFVAMCADAAASLADSMLPGAKPAANYMVTGLSVAPAGALKPEITLQVRDNWTPAADGVYLPSIAIPSAMGPQDLVANTDAPLSQVTGSTYTLAVDAPVQLGGDGEFIAGDVQHGVEQLQLQYVGLPALTLDADALLEDWKILNLANPKTSTSMFTSAHTLERGLARWVAA